MIKKDRYIVTGLDQDTSPDKRKLDTAYDAENIQIINNGRNLSVKPLLEAIEFVTTSNPPDPNGFPSGGIGLYLIGSVEINDKLYMFVTDNTGIPGPGNTDFILEIEDDGTVNEILASTSAADLHFSTQYRIEAIANYENENIVKIYWTDGYHQVRFINVQDPSTKYNLVEEIDLDQPEISVQTGGNLIAGNIQYAYSLYNLNGSESVLAPLSEMLSITNYMEGFESGQDTGLSITVDITLDSDFDYIRLYSIHYQELNQTPQISLIVDEEIAGSTFSFVDDGNSFISELSDSEFTTIGGRPIVAQTLAPKRNRLFLGNITTNDFDPDIDVRAFAHASSSTNYAVENADGSGTTVYQLPNMPPETHDCVNADYTTYRFIQSSSSIWGVEGLNIRLSVVFETNNIGTIPKKSLKRGEIYRIGIVFYNNLGQRSPAKWITDIKMPHIEDEGVIPSVSSGGMRNILALEAVLLNQSSYTAEGVVNYQIVTVERTINDRTIVSQGVIQPTVQYHRGTSGGGGLNSPYYHPYYITKDLKVSSSLTGAKLGESYEAGVDWVDPTWFTNDISYPTDHSEFCVFYSADTILNEQLPSVSDIKIIGSYTRNAYNGTTKLERYENNVAQGPLVINSNPQYYNLDSSPYPGTNFPYILLGAAEFSSADPIDTHEAVYLHRYTGTFKSPNTGSPDISLNAPSQNIKEGETKAFDPSYPFSNSVNISDLYTFMNTGGAPVTKLEQIKYNHRFPASVVLKFVDTFWHVNLIPWGKFLADVDRDGTLGAIPIIELIRNLPNQYNGASYEAKQRNSYLIEGTLGTVATTTINYVGDVYIGALAFQRANAEHSLVHQAFNVYDYVYVSWIENNQNVFGRNDDTYEVCQGLNAAVSYQNYRLVDNHQLLTAYNQKPNLILAPSKPANFTTVNNFTTIVQASEEKFSNELIDSWTKFPVNDTKELESIYGSITKLYNFKGEIYAFQKSGICQLSINPRIQTQATDGINIELGIGAVFYDHKYLSTKSGTEDKFTVADDTKMLYYYDRIFNTINVVADDKLSTLKGVKQILDDNALNGIISTTYDRKRDDIIFVFDVEVAGTYSLIYNSLLQKFICKLSNEGAFDGYYHMFKDKLLYKDVNIMKKYGNTSYLASSVTYLFGSAPIFEKVFHNLEYRLYGDNFDQIQITGNRNTSNLENIDLKTKFDNHRVHLPRISGTRERFREHYILVKLLNNSGTLADYSLDDMVIMYNIKG